jgi:hypothetical protein
LPPQAFRVSSSSAAMKVSSNRVWGGVVRRLSFLSTPASSYVLCVVVGAAEAGEAAAHPGVRGVELQLRRRLAGHAVLGLRSAAFARAPARQKGDRI